MKLAFLDVGHGNATVLQEHGRAIVVDTPPGRTLRDYLLSSNVSIIDEMVISHADKDHLGGLAEIISSGILVSRIWITDDQANRTRHYVWLRSLFQSSRLSTPILRGFPHSDVPALVFGGYDVKFVGPNHEDRMIAGNRNRLSVVVRISNGQKGVALLPGDLDKAGLEQLSPHATFSAQWLAAPHHGGRAGAGAAAPELIDELLERTGAEEVVFSFGREDGYMLPRLDVLATIAERRGDLRVRCTQLSKHCCDSLEWRNDSHAFQHEFGDGLLTSPARSCAGSIEVDLQSGLTWPLGPKHDAFKSILDDRKCLLG